MMTLEDSHNNGSATENINYLLSYIDSKMSDFFSVASTIPEKMDEIGNKIIEIVNDRDLTEDESLRSLYMRYLKVLFPNVTEYKGDVRSKIIGLVNEYMGGMVVLYSKPFHIAFNELIAIGYRVADSISYEKRTLKEPLRKFFDEQNFYLNEILSIMNTEYDVDPPCCNNDRQTIVTKNVPKLTRQSILFVYNKHFGRYITEKGYYEACTNALGTAYVNIKGIDEKSRNISVQEAYDGRIENGSIIESTTAEDVEKNTEKTVSIELCLDALIAANINYIVRKREDAVRSNKMKEESISLVTYTVIGMYSKLMKTYEHHFPNMMKTIMRYTVDYFRTNDISEIIANALGPRSMTVLDSDVVPKFSGYIIRSFSCVGSGSSMSPEKSRIAKMVYSLVQLIYHDLTQVTSSEVRYDDLVAVSRNLTTDIILRESIDSIIRGSRNYTGYISTDSIPETIKKITKFTLSTYIRTLAVALSHFYVFDTVGDVITQERQLNALRSKDAIMLENDLKSMIIYTVVMNSISNNKQYVTIDYFRSLETTRDARYSYKKFLSNRDTGPVESNNITCSNYVTIYIENTINRIMNVFTMDQFNREMFRFPYYSLEPSTNHDMNEVFEKIIELFDISNESIMSISRECRRIADFFDDAARGGLGFIPEGGNPLGYVSSI